MSKAHAVDSSGGASMRVIVIGRPVSEATIRRQSDVELIRARTPAMAIGEVSAPLASHGQRIVVLFDGRSVDPGESSSIADAIRLVDPNVTLIAEQADGAASTGCFDATITPGADEESIRLALMHSTEAEHVEAPRPAPVSTETPAEIRPGEALLIDALLHGRDALALALEALSKKHGLPVRFDDTGGADGAPVRRGETTFGVLCANGVGQTSLQADAQWLAGWLALEEQHKQLRVAAFTDELTGAWNRRYFRRFLESALTHARDERRDVTLMIFDIDDFKVYNDRFGHGAGDDILVETVNLLCSVIRPTDRVCRIGGDEFAVIFDDPRGARSTNGQHPTSIAEIAERFQRQICEHRFPKLGSDAPSTLTISGGMATFPWDGHDLDGLFSRADSLALESKRQGKNVITLGPGAERVCRLRFSEDDGPGPGA